MPTVYKGFTIPTTADAPHAPQLAQGLVDGIVTYRSSGRLTKVVRNVAAGGLSASWVDVVPAITIPANPFGEGVAYQVEAKSAVYFVAGANAATNLRAQLDGVDIDMDTQQQTASGQGYSLKVNAVALVPNPAVTHSVTFAIRSVNASSTVPNTTAQFCVVSITPAVALP